MEPEPEATPSNAIPVAAPELPPILTGAQTAAAATTPALERETEPFRFHGKTREYFQIWIVNTLLTILTLGVFSAWAKVRKRRYLRGNTELLGHRFDYTADPLRILVGNLLVVSLFLTYVLFGAVYPAARFIALGVGVLLLPWVAVRSLAFNAHHTVWRGLRFRFHPSVSAGAMLYLFQPVLILVTLGLYYPAWARARSEFAIGRHRLGTAQFRFESKNGPFYRAYLAGGGMMFIGALAVGAYSAFLTTRNGGHVPTTAQLLPALLIYGIMLFVAKHYIFAQLFNHIWGGTRLAEHRFGGKMRAGKWLGLQLTNLGAIIVSCGLLYPWALMRSTRYALESLHFHPGGPLEKILSLSGPNSSAVSDTAAEFAGLDFGL